MSEYTKFDSEIYSEELYSVSEQEYDEVMQASAVDDGWQGYSEWSAELEQGQIVNTPNGEILINRDCSHKTCLSTRCDKDVRVGGIAI